MPGYLYRDMLGRLRSHAEHYETKIFEARRENIMLVISCVFDDMRDLCL